MFALAALRRLSFVALVAITAGCSGPIAVDADALRSLENTRGVLRKLNGPMRISGVKAVYESSETGTRPKDLDTVAVTFDVYRLEDSNGAFLLKARTDANPSFKLDGVVDLDGYFVLPRGEPDELASYLLVDACPIERRDKDR